MAGLSFAAKQETPGARYASANETDIIRPRRRSPTTAALYRRRSPSMSRKDGPALWMGTDSLLALPKASGVWERALDGPSCTKWGGQRWGHERLLCTAFLDALFNAVDDRLGARIPQMKSVKVCVPLGAQGLRADPVALEAPPPLPPPPPAPEGEVATVGQHSGGGGLS